MYSTAGKIKMPMLGKREDATIKAGEVDDDLPPSPRKNGGEKMTDTKKNKTKHESEESRYSSSSAIQRP
jgi:hypothetical protein